MTIKLMGLFDESIGGFQCLRGYAPLRDLAQISEPNQGIQRNLLKDHKQEISAFYEDREYLFFPEIILVCPLVYDFNIKNAVTGLNPEELIQNRKNFKSNVNDTRIRFKRSASTADSNGWLQPVQAMLILNPEKKPFLSRIDGNHRLEASKLKPEFGEYNAPFCIIFLPQEGGGDLTKEDGGRPSKVIFNNINFKHIPLTQEHSLKIILNEFKNDEELQHARFGWPYWYTKKLMECVEAGSFLYTPFLKKSGDNHHNKCRTTIFELCRFLEEEKSLKAKSSEFINIKHAVQKADINLEGCNATQGLFIATVYLILETPKRLPEFLKWVKVNSLNEIKEISPKTLINIFSQVFEKRKKQIFISMPFGKEDTEDHYDHIVEAIQEINSEHNLSIEIKPIRVDNPERPTTFQITDEILEFIDNSGLLIADLTYANPNVYHEVGYAMGLAKERGLENNIILILKDGLPKKNSDVKFNLQGYSQLRFKKTSNLKNEVKKCIKNFYCLG